MRYQFIEEHHVEYPVTLMCQVLGVAHSSYYGRRKQPLSRWNMADLLLLMHIRNISAERRESYGSYRIQAELTEQNIDTMMQFPAFYVL